MDYYRYKAQDEKGKTVSGTMQANDEVELQSRLKNDNLFLVSYKKEKQSVSMKRLKSNEVSEFARSIGELMGAGVTLVRALKIVSEDESITEKQRELYGKLLKDIRTGISLSEALDRQSGVFPSLFVNMIRSSENTGNMDKIALQMAVYYDKEYRLNQKVKSAMTYPKILCVLIVAVVVVIMGYVIPQFESLFAMMDELPFTTSALLAISGVVKNKWYMMIFFGIIIFMFLKILFSIPQVKYLMDKIELHLPKIGKLRKVIYTARFARTLSSLYSAGIPITTCLAIAKTTIGNKYIEKQFDSFIAEVRAGGNLSDAVEKVDGFTKKLASSIRVGEETGAMDNMLTSTADQMEYDSEIALQRLVALLEPTMIVVMAVIVGFIMVAVIQPIYGSYETIATSY